MLLTRGLPGECTLHSAQARDRECSGLCLVHSVSWAARRVPSVMGGHCLVLPRTLATPVTNQRPGNPGTDQSEARHQGGRAPLGWSGPGRRLA